MSTITQNEFTPSLAVINGVIKTNTLAVAGHFDKQHKSVLRAIRNLDCSTDFHQRNFAPMLIDVEIGQGATRKDPAYEMTKDGFTFLAMGFTGKEAAKWKEAYINAFNQMAEQLHQMKQLPEPKTKKALPNGLTLEMQDCIKALVKVRAEELPKEKQAGATIRIWSAVKKKFGCTYKEIAPENYVNVVSLIGRLPLSGELLLKSECPKYQAPLSDWHLSNTIGAHGWLTYKELIRVEPSNRPLSKILHQLKRDGNDIDGAMAEYDGMKLLLESFYWKLDSLKSIFEVFDKRGLNIRSS